MSIIELVMALGVRHLALSAVLVVLALLLVRLRALNAEHRSWLLATALALAMVLPLSAFLPRWGTTLPASAPHVPALSPLPAEGARMDEGIYEAGHRADMLYLEIPKSLPAALVLVWALGTLWMWMRLLDAALQARRLRRSARRAPELDAALAGILPQHVRIATTAADGPMLVGLWRPCILLPRALVGTIDAAALRDIVRHELAHVRRHDVLVTVLLRAAMAVYWWNPLLRVLHARLALAREMACDARAAAAAHGRLDYAGSLLASIDRLHAIREQQPSLALGMFELRSQLTQRIDGLLVDEPDPASASHRHRAVVLGVLLLAACTGLAMAVVPRVTLPGDPAASTDPRVTALLAAARDRDIARMRALVHAGTDVNARVLGDGTALIQAVRTRDLATVDALLALGADPNRAALGEGNPLIAAAHLGAQPIVERLVAAGADVNRVVTYDETPLINAARGGHLQTVRYLVAHGANVNFGVEADGWLGRWRTPLNQARDPAVRAYLIERGAMDQSTPAANAQRR
jgi:beta-lactamase regulating signal transducer with metallopeptidase domain